MPKPNYSDPADREQMEARIRALAIAHDPGVKPEEVVARAKAYIDFVEAV